MGFKISSIGNAFKRLGQQVVLFFQEDFYIAFAKILATYAVWILLLPIILLGMAQGREMFIGMFDENTTFTAIRGASLVAMFVAQALAMVLVPRPFFKNCGLEDWRRVRPTILKKESPSPGLLFMVSILPIYFYGAVMIYVQRDRLDPIDWAISLITIVVCMVLVYQSYHFWKRFKTWHYIAICAGIIVLVGVLLKILTKIQDPFWNYFIVGAGLLAETIFLAGIARNLTEKVFLDNASWPKSRGLKLYDTVYWAVAGSVAVLWWLCFFSPNLDAFSPSFVLLLITTFYLLLTVFFQSFYVLKVQTSDKFWLKLGWWALWFGLLWFIFIFPSGIHNIHSLSPEGSAKVDQRLDAKSYFKGWWLKNIDTSKTAIPIYLVAAQGGGSRAGIWTSSILNELERRTGGRFHKHCFAVTSASGGSSGMGATLALWEFMHERRAGNPGLAAKAQILSDSLCYARFPRGMYQRNYLSGSFFELLCNEIPKRFAFSKNPKNRNYRHQRAEALGFADGVTAALVGGTEDEVFDRARYKMSSLFAKGDKPTLEVGRPVEEIPNYPFRPFLSYWYDEKGAPRFEWPIYLPITTNLHNGKSGFCSAVKMDSVNFIDALDILKAVDTMRGKDEPRALSLVAASNLSQLFPAMNAYTFIPGAGNFIDGGTYENLGNSAMLEIYRNLRKSVAEADFISPEVKKKVEFRVLFLINDEMGDRGYKGGFSKKKKINQISANVGFAGNTSIEGRETYWLDRFRLETQANNGDKTFEIILQENEMDRNNRIPLGRWLSKKSVLAVREKVGIVKPVLDCALEGF